ncbi:SRPBCC family protein [Actinacidiphila glaucinigra]|uniref:SRPBCC family protein n=1 Tax=Actinacidiphila glaucinigra TaxID=235986 RepID=UPI0033A4A297
MELHHEFGVPVPVADAWRALLDIERVAPCMPGATVEEYDGETVRGTVKVKVGPVTVTYRGTAVFEERDGTAHRVVLAARGKEVRGQGTARAMVTGTLTEKDGATVVSVTTDLAVTGRPAQFGRGVMAEVGDRIIGQFADCLAGRLAAPQAPAGGEDAAEDAPLVPAGHEDEPLDLLRVAGAPLAKRAAAAGLVAAAVGAAVVVFLRRRRH